MPYHVDDNHADCPGSAVVNAATGAVVPGGCHPTHEAAVKHMQALYVNVPDASNRAQLDTSTINDLPDSAFAYIEPGGTKDAQGKTVPRSLRHFPIHDAAHVRAAMARAPQSPFGEKAMPKIMAAAKKFGIGDMAAGGRGAFHPATSMFLRSYPLEDIRILTRAQGSEYADGRTVEAYAAVFDRRTEIHDGQGHYFETIDRNAFNKAIADAKPQGNRQVWRTGVFYNHGMTIHGTPSDRFSVPLGSPIDIRAEPGGLLTVTRYNNTSLADEILESIRSGDITGHSFTGRIVRSDPAPSRRGYEPDRRGVLPNVRRMELGLREYGPTPFPAYVDTAVVGVRSALVAALLSTTQEELVDELVEAGVDPEEAERMASDLEPEDSDTSPDEEAVPDEPPAAAEHSSRDSDPQRAAILQKIAVARATRPGL